MDRVSAVDSGASCQTALTRRENLTDLEIAVILTVLYSDIFDYSPSLRQIHQYLCLASASLAEVEGVVTSLVPEFLSRRAEQVSLRGREYLFELRPDRERRALERNPVAKSFAGWLARLPFVRLVAVSGSQAAENVRQDSDLDFFLLVEPGRVWIVQLAAALLRHLGRLRWGFNLCPNFLLATDAIELRPKNLYIAREISQMKPLKGSIYYEEFLAANDWLRELLPNWEPTKTPDSLRKSTPRLLEQCLQGWLGALLDRAIYGLMIGYYRIRLMKRGWDLKNLRTWYNRRHQKIMMGGYGPVVIARFKQRVSAVLGDDEEMSRFIEVLFGDEDQPTAQDPEFVREMRKSYGAGT